jgi:hypothetical protein
VQIEVQDEIDLSWNTQVTNDGIKVAWLQYAKQISTNNARLASIMNNHIPVLDGNTTLCVKLKNVTQDNELKAEKTRIFSFIKRKLQNAHLTLHTEVVLDEQQGRRAFTAAERAKLMAEKNPSLLLLTKKFDLDVEI